MTDFTRPWDLSDIVFALEGQHVYASKTIMSMWSPVMKAMFYDDFKEKHAPEIKLPGKLFEDILELVKVLHPPNTDLDETNVAIILPLAREYQMEEMTKRCERFLLQRPPSVLALVLAEEFDLTALQRQCMDYIRTSKLQVLHQEQDFEQLSSKTKVGLLMEKSMRYEHILSDVLDIVEGRKPEQKRFRAGGTLCTFTCPDKGFNEGLPHNAGTEKNCKSCSLYMITKIVERSADM